VWTAVVEDQEKATQYFHPIPTSILLGDGRTLTLPDEVENMNEGGATEGPTSRRFFERNLDSFDLIIYLPPYPNNIDYTEVYKIELWMSGFISNKEEFTALRHETMRSHPSVRFRRPMTYLDDAKTCTSLKEVVETLDILTDAVPDDTSEYASSHMSKERRSELFQGYFDDMYQALKHQRDVLRPGGWIFCVVGNAMHGSGNAPEGHIPVASDLIIATLAQAVGLEVKAIEVARHLTRNLKLNAPGRHLRRESIIVMQKPERSQPSPA
jgi:hypothetical protein